MYFDFGKLDLGNLIWVFCLVLGLADRICVKGVDRVLSVGFV